MKRLFLFIGIIALGVVQVQAQSWKEVAKKLASDKAERDEYGYSIAISGTTAVVGAIGQDYDAIGGNYIKGAGAAYILEQDGSGNWNEIQKIVASDRTTGSWFGWSVSISGNVLIVGAYQKEAAYIFEKNSSGVWSEVQKIEASDKNSGDYFGYGVAVSGTNIIIGASQVDNGIYWYSGAAYIFERNTSGVWNQVKKIVASDKGSGDYFGRSVSISGTAAIVGADENNAAYIFERNSVGDWNEVQKIESTDVHAGDNFGDNVAISGTIAVVGAYREKEDATGGNTLDDAGSAYVFERNASGGWNQTQKIVASDRDTNDFFGIQVAVSGTTIVIGAYLEREDATGGNTLYRAGSAYIYDKNSSGFWNQTQKIVASDRAEKDLFAYGGVAIDGNTILVGSSEKNVTGSSPLQYAGAVYFYKRETTAVKDINAQSIGLNIIPNPSSGQFLVNAISLKQQPIVISITNVLGQELMQTKTITNIETPINLDVSAGMYFLNVSTDNIQQREAIVIQ